MWLLWANLIWIAAACQSPGPPATPTLPAFLDHTASPTPVELTATPTATPTRLTSSTPTLPAATDPPPATPTPFIVVATYTPSVTASSLPMTFPPPPPPPATVRVVTATAGPRVAESNPTTAVGLPSVLAIGVVYYTPVAGLNSLPVSAAVPVADLPTAAANTGFEGRAAPQGAQEVVAPAGWLTWWRSGPVDCALYAQLGTMGPCPAVEYPGLAYRRPEFSVIPRTQQWLDPPRIYSGGQAARFFCTYGICIAGYVQRVQVTPGQQYVLGAWGHSWCSDNTDDPYHSQLETQDARLNCELAVGLDPTGGLDPFSPAVVWQTLYTYDTYTYLQTPPVTAERPVMTLYLRGRSLWGLRHNDFHFDQVTFTPF